MESKQEIKLIPLKLRKPADLPKEFKAFPPAYQNPGSELYIRPELRNHISVITARSLTPNKSDIYIICDRGGKYDEEVQNFSRKFVVDIKNSALRYNASSCYVAQVSPESKIVEHINNVIKPSNNAVKASSKTKSDIEFVEEILVESFNQGASDIHVESQNNGMACIRIRVNKELHLIRWITQNEAEVFAAVCYSTFPANTEDRGTAKGTYKSGSLLEGIFQRKIIDQDNGNEIYIKGRMLNLAHNEQNKADFIIRIIDKNKNNKAVRFVDMGFSEHASRLLRALENISSGAILTCGVTGSGKSTTQTNMVQHERDRSGGRRKIILIEDPVEYDMELVTQITAGEKKDGTTDDNDFSFSNVNKKNMRADPDSLGYGEIRDQDTTKNMIKGALTGHLVYGTIHTSGALEVFERLAEMGASMAEICREGFIRLVLFQHLLPKICPHCAVSYTPGDPIPEKYSELFVAKMMLLSDRNVTAEKIAECHEAAKATDTSLFRTLQRKGLINAATVRKLQEKRDILNETSDQKAFALRLQNLVDRQIVPINEVKIRFRGDGCRRCLEGHKGVTPVAEVLLPDSEFLSMIKNGMKESAKLYWRTRLGGKTALEDSYERILKGVVDPRSVETHLDKLGS